MGSLRGWTRQLCGGCFIGGVSLSGYLGVICYHVVVASECAGETNECWPEISYSMGRTVEYLGSDQLVESVVQGLQAQASKRRR